MTLASGPAFAGTTGTISGTVTDATSGAPVANATVAAASPSGSRTTTTDSKGFYVLQALLPDTYLVSVQATGYEAQTIPGITVQQDQIASENIKLSKTLSTIANVHARSSGNLVQPNQTSDVYTVSGAQLDALSGGNNLHKTLYQYIQGVAGVTSSGFPAQPRIHGGSITDIAYEFDGIPIKERITGFFTTNLSNVGLKNVEVTTGGLSAGDAASGLGIINTVVKTGTYPGFAIASYGATTNVRNTYVTLEYGGATKNGKFSWYGALDKVNSLNEYASGLTYPALNIEGSNGPGPVKTTDMVFNFHYKPTQNDDFQFLYQNGLGDFIYSYLMQRDPGQPVPLTARVCPGAVADPSPGHVSYTGGVGGVAPNGQPCPLGLYFGTANTQAGGGNIWHHYSGIGKIQWSHILNDHSLFTARIAENFNQYIFDQPIVESNLLPYEDGDFAVRASCPPLPYTAGSPILNSNYPGTGGPACTQQANWLSTGFYGDRRSNMYLGSIDYTNNVNANTTIKLGAGTERDTNLYNYYYTFFFNADGTWPATNFTSNYPSLVNYVYAQGSFRVNKFLLSPGIRYQRMTYQIPTGARSNGIWNPTFAATYTMGANDVIRGSFTNSTSFVGTGYVYRNVPSNALNGYAATTPYTPGTAGFSTDPTILHSGDLQWEHQFDANTSLKFGPWFNNASNVFYLFRPVTSYDPVTGDPKTYGPQLPTNGGMRKAFGFELAVSHTDNRKSGVSWWLNGTYDNFWTSITSSLTSSYNVSPLPDVVKIPIRSTFDPLFSATITADIHQDDFSLMPTVYYQTPSFYNVGTCWNKTKTGSISCTSTSSSQHVPVALQPEKMSTGYFIANATALWRVGPKRDLVIGVQGSNLLNNTHDIAPCTSTQLGGSANILYPGCAPFWPSSPGGPDTALGSTYQNYSQTPVTIEFFITKKF